MEDHPAGYLISSYIIWRVTLLTMFVGEGYITRNQCSICSLKAKEAVSYNSFSKGSI